MTEVNEVCSMGLTFDPGWMPLTPVCSCFTVLVALDAFWFVDSSFLSLFSQEAMKAAGTCVCIRMHMYVYVCVSKTQYSSLGTSPVETMPFLQLLCYKMVEDSPYKWLGYYLPHCWKHGMWTCRLFDLICHNIGVHWVSKQLSKTIYSWWKYKWNPFKVSTLQIWVL